jgi:hypothetical protein
MVKNESYLSLLYIDTTSARVQYLLVIVSANSRVY